MLALCGTTLLSHAGIEVKPAGMQVVWNDGAEHFNGFKTYNSKPGIQVVLMLFTDGERFVAMDNKASKIAVEGAKGQCWFFGSQSLSKDGKVMKVRVDAEGAKNSGGKVSVKGDVVITTASSKGKLSTGMIEWKKGAMVKFPKESGLPTFKISEIGKPKWGDEKWEVTLECNAEFEKFVSVQFVDDQGNEQEGKRGSWSSMGMGGIKKVSVSYKAKKPITKGEMVIEYWQGIKKVKVPVDLSLGINGVGK